MKTAFSKLTFAVIFTLALALTFSCAEAAATATITIDKRIIGTWEQENGLTIIFNSDGTGVEQKNKRGGGEDFKYALYSDTIILYYSPNNDAVLNYVFSADGKTLILYKSRVLWFNKK